MKQKWNIKIYVDYIHISCLDRIIQTIWLFKYNQCFDLKFWLFNVQTILFLLILLLLLLIHLYCISYKYYMRYMWIDKTNWKQNESKTMEKNTKREQKCFRLFTITTCCSCQISEPYRKSKQHSINLISFNSHHEAEKKKRAWSIQTRFMFTSTARMNHWAHSASENLFVNHQ